MKNFIGLLLLALPLIGIAQSAEQTALQKNLSLYYQANEQKDWEAVVGMVYPPLVEMASREALVQMFEDLEGNGMIVEMNGFETKAISPAFEYEGERYAKVEYLSDISMQFTSEAYKDPSVTDMIKANFEREYGAEQVEFDKSSNTFTIHADRAMLAIQQEANDSPWTFMELDASNPLNETLIPEAVSTHFEAKP